MVKREHSLYLHTDTESSSRTHTGASCFRVGVVAAVFLLALVAVGCGQTTDDPKRLVGLWVGGAESLTLFADGTFLREVKMEVASRPGTFQTYKGARGKWEAKSGSLHFTADQIWSNGEYRKSETPSVADKLWADASYQWEIKESSIKVQELHLRQSGESQPTVFRRLPN